MSEWIANQLRDLRKMQDDIQTVIDALDPPKPKRKYKRRKPITVEHQRSPERRELDVNLRSSTVAPRDEERMKLLNGEHEVSHVTSGGRQDG